MKWYQKPWSAVLFLFLFFPVGLFLMWRYQPWKMGLKIAVTAVIGVIFIAVIVPGDPVPPGSPAAVMSLETGADFSTTSTAPAPTFSMPPMPTATTTSPSALATTLATVATMKSIAAATTTTTRQARFVVYWGHTGDKVHISPNCRTITNGVLSGTLDECKAEGHTDGWCGVCSGGWSDERFYREGNPYAD